MTEERREKSAERRAKEEEQREKREERGEKTEKTRKEKTKEPLTETVHLVKPVRKNMSSVAFVIPRRKSSELH